MVLTLYCDDSGSNYKKPFCVLAGYVTRAESWERFADEWQEQLLVSPSVKFMKMSEAYSRTGNFAGWDEASVQHKLFQMASIIDRYRLTGVGSLISNNAYSKIARGYLPKTVDHPYWMCQLGLRILLAKSAPPDCRIDLVLDRQGEGYERRSQLQHSGFNEMLTELGHESHNTFGTVSFADGDEVVPLQAAEMLAWHIRDYADNKVTGTMEDREIAKVLLSSQPTVFTWEPEQIHGFVLEYQRLHPHSPINQPEKHQ